MRSKAWLIGLSLLVGGYDPFAAMITEIDEDVAPDNPPARTAVIVPDGDMATVWIYTFGT